GRSRGLGSQRLQAKLLAQISFQFGGHISVLFQKLLYVFAALTDALAPITEPGSGFLHQVPGHSQVHQVAFAGNALAVHDVKFGFAEGRSSLVFDHFDLGAVTDPTLAVLDSGNAPDAHTPE